MATIKDVAKMAGVSAATVSRVLNKSPRVSPKARSKIEKAIEALSFRPNANARALVKQDTNTLGVIISELSDPFFAAMANSIEQTASQKGLNVLLSTGGLDEERERAAIQQLIAHRCNAMVVNSKKLCDQELIAFARKIPGFVLINKYIPEIAERCVWLDNIKGGQSMARYITKLGHHNIAIFSTREKEYDATRRLQGIELGLAEAGLSISAMPLFYESHDHSGGERAVEALLASGQTFTAILAYNDAQAAGAISRLVKAGYRIPHDVSIIGFDDILQAKYCIPQLTTVRYPINIMAARATELALELCDSSHTKQQAKTLQYTPIVIERQSTMNQ